MATIFQYPRSDRRRCNSAWDNTMPRSFYIFQYPRSDRRRCNSRSGRPGPGSSSLSVSSVGSEAMQLRPMPAPMTFWRPLSVSSVGSEAMQLLQVLRVAPHPHKPFSILGRIGGDATPGDVYSGMASFTTFSILGRIGGDATTTCEKPARSHLNFQYPRSDRRRCNGRWRFCAATWKESFSILGRIGGDATWLILRSSLLAYKLSVSSVGSEAMQLSAVVAVLLLMLAFSILGRIGGDATLKIGDRVIATIYLSVSSVGSEAMQHSASPATVNRRLTLSVSSVGSEAMQLIATLRQRGLLTNLSVSSVGSEAMQPLAGKCALPGLATFSILGRIGGDATCFGPVHLRVADSPFSILGRIGGDATPLRRTAIVVDEASFSILGRIGGDATKISRAMSSYPP